MAKIIASGVPEKYDFMGDIRITVEGTDVKIHKITYETNLDGVYVEDPSIELLFDMDMKEGPNYPLCAPAGTMRRALFILYEWFGEDKSCWIKEPEHVLVEGEIEPMESEPGVIY